MFKATVRKFGGSFIRCGYGDGLEWSPSPEGQPCILYKRTAKCAFERHSPIGELYDVLKTPYDTPKVDMNKPYKGVIKVYNSNEQGEYNVELHVVLTEAELYFDQILSHLDKNNPDDEYLVELFVFE